MWAEIAGRSAGEIAGGDGDVGWSGMALLDLEGSYDSIVRFQVDGVWVRVRVQVRVRVRVRTGRYIFESGWVVPSSSPDAAAEEVRVAMKPSRNQLENSPVVRVKAQEVSVAMCQ